MREEVIRQEGKPREDIIQILARLERGRQGYTQDYTARTDTAKITTGQYCSYHKSRTHNTSECKAKGLHKIDEPQVIVEQPVRLQDTVIDLTINTAKQTALLDTGATFSYTRESVWLELGVAYNQNANQQEVRLANGNCLEVMGIADIEFSIRSNPYATYKVRARVVRNLLHGLILGVDFMQLAKVNIDFERSNIWCCSRSCQTDVRII